MAKGINHLATADGLFFGKGALDLRKTGKVVDEALKGDLEVNGRKYGLVLDIGGYYKNVVTLAPSLHISKDEMDLALQLLDCLLGRVTKDAR